MRRDLRSIIGCPLPAASLPFAQLLPLFAAGWMAGVLIGKLPPTLPLLRTELGLDLVMGGWLLSLVQVAGMCVGLLGGAIAERLGLRRALLVGLTLCVLGGFVGAEATNAREALIARGLEGVGFLLVVLPVPAMIAARVPPTQLRVVMGAWAMYMPAGMGLGLLVTPWLHAALGWRGVWRLFALLTALVALWLWRASNASASAAPKVRTQIGRLAWTTLRAPGPWLLSLTFFFYAGQWIGLFGFLPSILNDAGLSLTRAGVITGLAIWVNVLGTTSGGWLMQHGVPRAALIALATAVMALGALIAYAEGWPLWVRIGGVFMFSTLGGWIPGVMFASAPSYAPHPKAVSTTVGLIQQCSSLGQFLAAPLMAGLAVASGGWHSVGFAVAALSLPILGLAAMVARFDQRALQSSPSPS